MFLITNYLSHGAGETPQQLRAFAALLEDPSTHIRWLTPSATLAPGVQHLQALWAGHKHAHNMCRDTQLHMSLKKNKQDFEKPKKNHFMIEIFFLMGIFFSR